VEGGGVVTPFTLSSPTDPLLLTILNFRYALLTYTFPHFIFIGDEPFEPNFEDIEPMDEDNNSVSSEFITIKVTNEDGEGQTEEKIKDHTKYEILKLSKLFTLL
jgi:hypothetical protein